MAYFSINERFEAAVPSTFSITHYDPRRSSATYRLNEELELDITISTTNKIGVYMVYLDSKFYLKELDGVEPQFVTAGKINDAIVTLLRDNYSHQINDILK